MKLLYKKVNFLFPTRNRMIEGEGIVIDEMANNRYEIAILAPPTFKGNHMDVDRDDIFLISKEKYPAPGSSFNLDSFLEKELGAAHKKPNYVVLEERKKKSKKSKVKRCKCK